MDQPQWSPYCPKTGQKHPDAWACGTCGATRPRPTQTSIRTKEEVEFIDLSSDSPEKSTATTVFTHYNRSGGAEQHRQAAITRTKKQVVQSSFVSATVLFYLLKQSRNEEGFFSPVSCKSLGTYNIHLSKVLPTNSVSRKGFNEDQKSYD
jgi:hypothetical protein